MDPRRPHAEWSQASATAPMVARKLLPTFVIGGVRKAATTALWHLLAEHPDVGMGSVKEPQFFSRDRGRVDTGDDFGPPRSGTFDRGWEWYARQFHRAQHARARGEASTMYFDASDSARLLRASLPDIRIIFCLRHPVDRIYSHYWFERQSENLPDFTEMVLTRHRRLEWYVYQSHYGRHLERFFDQFGADQIHLVLDSDLASAPAETLGAVHRFLGLDPCPPPTEARRRNVATRSRSVAFNRLLTQHRSEWTKYLPHRLTPFAYAVKEWAVRRNAIALEYPAMDSRARAALVDEFAADVDAVERAVERDLSAWRS